MSCDCEPRTGKVDTGGMCSCGCGCGISRRFYSSKEKIERLEAYRDNLKKELQGVEEHLSELKAE